MTYNVIISMIWTQLWYRCHWTISISMNQQTYIISWWRTHWSILPNYQGLHFHNSINTIIQMCINQHL